MLGFAQESIYEYSTDANEINRIIENLQNAIKTAKDNKDIGNKLDEIKKNIMSNLSENIIDQLKSQNFNISSEGTTDVVRIIQDLEESKKRNEIWLTILQRYSESKMIITNETVHMELKKLNADTRSQSSVISTLKGVDFQNYFITALSSIIADQLKSDIIELYLGRFVNKFRSNVFVKTFFPVTIKNFNPEDIFYYRELSTTWKKSFETDLCSLPDHLFQYIEQCNPDDKKIGYAKLVYDIIKGLNDNAPLFSKIKSIANDPFFQKYEGLQSTLKLVVWLQEKFQTFGTNNLFWDIINDDFKTRILLNEIYNENKDFFEWIKLDKEEDIQKQIKDIREKILAIYKDFKEIVRISKISGELSKQDAIKYLEHSIGLITHTISIGKRVKLEEKNETIKTQNSAIDKVNDFVNIVESVYAIYQSINEQNYTLCLQKSMNFLKNLIIIKEDTDISTAIDTIVKYSSFIEGIASAQNIDDMKDVISKVMMPPLSYLVKRRTKFSISISAHPGIFSGYECIDPIDSDASVTEGGLTAGITVPVGLEFCWGGPKKYHTSGALLLSLLDPAAVVSYLFRKPSNDYSGLPQNMTFQQIFAPGAFFYYGMKDSPICFFGGFQFMPELRKIVEGDIVKNRAHSYRIITGISWDIGLIGISPRDR
jgi:hypothetical protein